MADSNTTSGSDGAEKPRLSLKLKKGEETSAPEASAPPPASVDPKEVSSQSGLETAGEATTSEAKVGKTTTPKPRLSVARQSPTSEEQPPALPDRPVKQQRVESSPPSSPQAPAGAAFPATPPGTVPAPRPVKVSEDSRSTPAESSHGEPSSADEKEGQGRPFKTLALILLVLVALGGGVAFFGSNILASFSSDPEPAEAGDGSPASTPPAQVEQQALRSSEPGRITGALGKARAVADTGATRVAQYDEVAASVTAPQAATPERTGSGIQRPPNSGAEATVSTPVIRIETQEEPAPEMSNEVQGLPEVYALMDSFSISMVMPSPRGDRIVIDNVAYGQGDVLEPSWGLRFVRAEPQFKRLVFRDSRGAVYYKSY